MSVNTEIDDVKRDRKRADAAFLVIVLSGMITGALYALNEKTTLVAPSIAMAIYAICGIVFVLAFAAGMGPYWRAIGENARRNHLDAWFWGGSLGFTLMGCAIGFAALGVAPVDLPIANLTPVQVLGVGAGALAAATLAGYALHWTFLTLTRRPTT